MLEDLTYVRTRRVTLCVRDRGTGPVIVLLHGTSASLGVWDRLVQLLGTGVRTIAVDQRGHGRSDKPDGGYGAEEYCADIAELLGELDTGPALIVGHSLGGRNAVVLAAHHRDLVGGVVVVDYAPFVRAQVLDELRRRVQGGDRTFRARSEIAAYLRDRYPLMPADAVERRVIYGYAETEHGYRPLADPRAMVATVDGLRRDFDREFHDLACPATLVRGRRSAIVTDETIAAAAALRPDIPVVELAGVDHYVPEEDPTAIMDVITRMSAATA